MSSSEFQPGDIFACRGTDLVSRVISFETSSLAGPVRWSPSHVAIIAHELKHNCGRSHTHGGVMNPSLVRGLQMNFDQDTSKSWLDRQFGGELVSTPGGGAPDPPTPDTPLQDEFRLLHVKDAIHDEAIDDLISEVRKR